jgi:hypothetical protein
MSFLDWSRALTSNQGELAAFFLMMIPAGLFWQTRDVLGSMPDLKILVLLKLASRFFRTADGDLHVVHEPSVGAE